jgi:hypothetical protein
LNTLVNFESALPSISGQFSVGVNSLVAVAPSEQNENPSEICHQINPQPTKNVCPDCRAENKAGVDRCVYCDLALYNGANNSGLFQVELKWPWGSEVCTLPLRIGREPPSPASLIKSIADHGYDNISRVHAELFYDSTTKEVSLTDLGSSNGTFVDGVRVPPLTPITLKRGAVLRFAAHLSVIFYHLVNDACEPMIGQNRQ